MAMLTAGVQGVHPRGVQEGVQTCGFVRGSRWAGNPVVAPVQFRPATKVKVQLHERSYDEGSLRDQGPFVVGSVMCECGATRAR